MLIIVLPKVKSQTPQNLIGISFVHRSQDWMNNNNGVGINLERYNSKIKYLSYGLNAEYFGPSKYLNFNNLGSSDGFGVNTISTFKIGGRLALHLQKGKFDFYAGAQLSYVRDNYHFTEFNNKNSTTSATYNPYGYGQGSYSSNINFYKEKYNKLLFEPFVGLRYFPIKNFGIQIEGSQRKTSLGLNVKF
jgi:hypothetical protein